MSVNSLALCESEMRLLIILLLMHLGLSGQRRQGIPLLFETNLERETGIEPATNGLGSRYSTIELLPLFLAQLE